MSRAALEAATARYLADQHEQKAAHWARVAKHYAGRDNARTLHAKAVRLSHESDVTAKALRAFVDTQAHYSRANAAAGVAP